MPADASAMLRIEVACSRAADRVDVVDLTLAPGATVSTALQSCGLLERAFVDGEAAMVGVWGQRASLDRVLRDGDRVEVYRPLSIDPKEARRLRAREQRRSPAPPRVSGSR